MAKRMIPGGTEDGGHRFGGDWTTHKLDVLASYLSSYTVALKRTPFRKIYIDAFAGTGYREARRQPNSQTAGSDDLLFPDLADTEPQALLHGSARLALATSPPFQQYVFIEKDAERCEQLEALRGVVPVLSTSIEVRRGDANVELRDLCLQDWSSQRAVLFLDPYGMDVEWSTLEAVARTRAIDLWMLFPLGIGVNRLLTRSGDIPASWRRRLDLLLGREDWYDEFYRVEASPTLFGADEERIVKASQMTIGQSFNRQLSTIFAGVAENPGVLRNSRNCPLFLLCFAVANTRGKEIALRIANHLLKGMS